MYNNKQNTFTFNKTWFLVFAAFFLNAQSSFNQTRVDSLEYIGNLYFSNSLKSRFEKQLNTFSLNTNLHLTKKFEDLAIRINENLGSTFIRNELGNTRDEQQLYLFTKLILSQNVNIGLSGNSALLSDNRSLGINESAVNYAALYSEIKPIKQLSIAPFAGYSNNRQIGRSDNGLLYGLEASLFRFGISELDITSELRFRNEDILPRRNLIRYYTLSVSNKFDKGFNNNIRTNFSQNRKDFYIDADSSISSTFNVTNNIQSRMETNFQLFDRLSYDGFLEIFSLDLAGGVNWKSIDREFKYKNTQAATKNIYDTKIDELKLELDAIAYYNSKLFNGSIRINFYERDEKHQVKQFDEMPENVFEEKSDIEVQKNNNSSRFTVSLNGDFYLSKNDGLTFSLHQSKLIYDTKSELNDDDRDELLSIARLRYTKRLNPYFSAFVNLEGTYGHTVYLFASRSSNNNVNRIFRLRTGGDYFGSGLKSFNSIEVSANYTVYDFKDVVINYKSYAFRQLLAIDSTTIKINNNVSLFSYGYIKISEIGDFDWADFSSRPTRYLEEIYFEPRAILDLDQKFFSVGLRLFALKTFSFKQNSKILDTEYLSLGPIAIIDISAWNKFNLILKGYYEFISNTNSVDKEQASLLMQVNWNF